MRVLLRTKYMYQHSPVCSVRPHHSPGDRPLIERMEAVRKGRRCTSPAMLVPTRIAACDSKRTRPRQWKLHIYGRGCQRNGRHAAKNIPGHTAACIDLPLPMLACTLLPAVSHRRCFVRIASARTTKCPDLILSTLRAVVSADSVAISGRIGDSTGAPKL
jgi:hypothetical protein